MVCKRTDEAKELRPRNTAERRAHPRYVESDRPFSLGTAGGVQITKGGDSFLSPTRVVSCSTKGMGLAFTEMAKEQFETLDTWLGRLRERDWLAQNRRRTQRVMLRVQVRVSG
jgi:hypothetical protein